MNNFAFYSPTEFVFGKGTESQTAELVKKYKGTKVMIVYGGGSVVRSGLLDKVKKYLDEAGIAHVELGGIQPNPTDPKVYEGIELGRREKSISCFRWEAVRSSIQPKPLQWVSLTKAISGISI